MKIFSKEDNRWEKIEIRKAEYNKYILIIGEKRIDVFENYHSAFIFILHFIKENNLIIYE